MIIRFGKLLHKFILMNFIAVKTYFYCIINSCLWRCLVSTCPPYCKNSTTHWHLLCRWKYMGSKLSVLGVEKLFFSSSKIFKCFKFRPQPKFKCTVCKMFFYRCRMYCLPEHARKRSDVSMKWSDPLFVVACISAMTSTLNTASLLIYWSDGGLLTQII